MTTKPIGSALLCLAFLASTVPILAGQRNAVLAGRINHAGAPVAGIRVAAVESQDPSTQGGAVIFVRVTETDRSGAYRLENIPPGRYIIMAGPIETPAYYPGSTLAGGATILTVTEGASRERLDFAVPWPTRPPGVTVSGRATGISDKARNRLSIVIQGPSPSDPRSNAWINADGTFELTGIQPGAYGIGIVGAGVIRDTLSYKSIVVEDKDVRDLALAATVQARVTGRIVVVDGNGRETAILPRPVSVAFVSQNTGAATVMVDPRGGFTLTLREGEYTISMPRLPAGFTIRSISSDSRNLLNTPVTIEWDAAILPITVTLQYTP